MSRSLRPVRWLAVLAVVLLLVGAAALRFVVLPPVEPLEPADAVVVLAGDPTARLPLARRLAEEGAGVLVISVTGSERGAPTQALCEDPGEFEVHCFVPGDGGEAADTRAEARALGRLVAEQGWQRITVVTNRYHAVRAGLLVRRCVDAEVQVAQARTPMSLRRWTSAVVGELGGLAFATVSRSC